MLLRCSKRLGTVRLPIRQFLYSDAVLLVQISGADVRQVGRLVERPPEFWLRAKLAVCVAVSGSGTDRRRKQMALEATVALHKCCKHSRCASVLLALLCVCCGRTSGLSVSLTFPS